MLQKYIKILVIILLVSCKSEVFNFSNIPAITMESDPVQFKLNGKDSLIQFNLKYTDGDGDIGLEPADTFAPFNFNGAHFYNLLIEVFEVENGLAKPIVIPLSTDTLNFNDRIRNLTPTGKNKSIFGTLTINLKAMPYPGIQPDSMFYTIQIVDRSLNYSNKIQTNTLSFNF